MRIVYALSFLLLLSCCKEPDPKPKPDPEPYDPPVYRNVTFYIHDYTPASTQPRPKMQCKIGTWDSTFETVYGVNEFTKKWKKRKQVTLGDIDTAIFYYIPNSAQTASGISQTKLSVEQNGAEEWSSAEGFPIDTLKVAIIK